MFVLDFTPRVVYNSIVRRGQPLTKGGRNLEEMNNADLTRELVNNNLETIAKLIEAKAKTIEEAVAIVRDCKLK